MYLHIGTNVLLREKEIIAIIGRKGDTDKSRIVVYSQIIQLFEIVVYQPVEENETDTVYSFTCKDNEGVDCTVSIITRKKQDNRKQLYINYGNRIIMYNIFKM